MSIMVSAAESLGLDFSPSLSVRISSLLMDRCEEINKKKDNNNSTKKNYYENGSECELRKEHVESQLGNKTSVSGKK